MLNKPKQLVVKFGTEVLLGAQWRNEKRLKQAIFNDIASQVVRAQTNGINITIVSSGAIQAGRERIQKTENNIIRLSNALSRKKELAGIGARHLLNMWGRGFERNNREIAQLWVTFSNLSSDGELQSIYSAILNYHDLNIIPIINENDVVSDNEIKLMESGLSENDSLTRMIAMLLSADDVLFITKSGGVYEKNPRDDSEAKRYSEINAETALEIADNELSKPNSVNQQIGQGGITAKIKEALTCFDSGMRVSIAGLDEEDSIYKFAMGNNVGTMIGKSVNFEDV